MAIQLDATTARSIDGSTGRQILEGFINVQTSGAREVAERLRQMAEKAGRNATPLLEKAAREASRPLYEAYRNSVGDVTGNLKKSVKIRGSLKKYPGVGIAIVGPLMTGNGGASERDGSGNHAWLVEFGTGRRKPGTQGRRTYITVHQSINRRMTRHQGGQAFNNEQFENMGRGYYFLMGSKNEPTRQARAGSGYPHDFGETNGRQHPITLAPGKTIAAMPARRAMQNAISSTAPQVLSGLISALERQIASL